MVKLLAQAERFRQLIETGKVRNQSDIACLEGLTRARVTQIMNLLKLHPAMLDFIRAMPATAPRYCVTEKKLRSLTTLTPAEQLAAAVQSIPALAASLRVAG